MERYHAAAHTSPLLKSFMSRFFNVFLVPDIFKLGKCSSMLALFPHLLHVEYNCSRETWLIRGHHLLMAWTGLREAEMAEREREKNSD